MILIKSVSIMNVITMLVTIIVCKLYNVKLVASDYIILEKDGVEYKYYYMDIVRRSRGKDTIVIKD